MAGVDPQLVRAVREGTYRVDPQAVAGAIVQRCERRADADRLAAVLESLERDGLPRRGPEEDPGAHADVA
jgi:hypothetical protein